MPGSLLAPPGLPVIDQARETFASKPSPRTCTVSPTAYWFWSCGAGELQVIDVVQMAPALPAATVGTDGPTSAAVVSPTTTSQARRRTSFERRGRYPVFIDRDPRDGGKAPQMRWTPSLAPPGAAR